MPVIAIQETQPPHKHTSYVGAAIIGGIVGHYTKFMLPITPQERDDNFKSEMKKVLSDARKARYDGINEVIASNGKTPAKDAFIRLSKQNKSMSEKEISKLPENIANELLKYKLEINEKVSQVIKTGRKKVAAATRDLRPAYAFIVTGAIVGLFAAFVKNLERPD